MAEESQTVIQREAPEIEAYKLGLLEQAKTLTGTSMADQLPQYSVAGLDAYQDKAYENALGDTGIGAYQPYLDNAEATIGTGVTTAEGGLTDIQTGMGYLDPATGQSMVSTGQSYLDPAKGYFDAGAEQAIGSASAYDPSAGINAFMDPYQQMVTQGAVDQMNKQYAMQQTGRDQQAIASGAFGGSRQGVMEGVAHGELADVTSRRIFEDLSKNYGQARTASMQDFQNQKARELASSGAQMQAGQGIGQLGLAAGQLGQTYSNIGNQAAQTAGQLGSAQGVLGAQLGQLGTSQAALGEFAQKAGITDINLLETMGATRQQQEQRIADAKRQNELQKIYEPYQRLSYYSDILRGAPSTQQTTSLQSSSSPSLFNQILGGGIAGLGLYGAANKSGLI
tara:strand:- start:511 stop:1695 length:1185 start_codon:yes stop_codon:yes gene_type:complete